jgi:hypothetical protein
LALQSDGFCALAGPGSNSARARMAAVAVTTFLIQVPIDVLRLVFVRFWTRCGCVWTFRNLLSECSRSPLLERCGESAHFGKRAALSAEAVDRVNAKSVQAMNKLNFPADLKSRTSNHYP